MTTLPVTRLEFDWPSLPEVHRQAPVAELYKQGFIAEGAEQVGLAGAYFGEVLRRQPDNPYVLLDMGRVSFELFEFDRGKYHLHDAERSAGRDPEFWYQIGLIWQLYHFEEEAERCFLLARSHGAGNPVFTGTLAAFYEGRGRLEEARSVLERARRKGMEGGILTTLEGMVLLRAADLPGAIGKLSASLAELPRDHPYQVVARYSLAQALARSGEEAASMERLGEAKALQEAQPHVKRYVGLKTPVMQEAAAIRTSLESTDIREAWRAEIHGNQSHPPLVFLLGYPRSGTTLLEQVVESHSGIHSYEETGAFNQAMQKAFGGPLLPGEKPWDRFNTTDPAARCLAREWYFEHLKRLGAPSEGSILIMDKNPGLTGHVHMISRLFPDAKFLFMVRDPRDICLSAYQTMVTITPFSVNWLDWDATVRHCVEMLAHWTALRDRLPNPYLEVRYEDLITDLPQTGRRVMEFLGLEWESRQEDFARHARSKQVYSPTLYDVRQGLSQQARGKWRRFGMDYGAGEPGLTALLESYGYEK